MESLFLQSVLLKSAGLSSVLPPYALFFQWPDSKRVLGQRLLCFGAM